MRQAIWSLVTFVSYSHLLRCLAAAPSGLPPATTHYDFNVTVAQRAPDCFGEALPLCRYAEDRNFVGVTPKAAIKCKAGGRQEPCYCSAEKSVLVVNGEFNKAIEVVQGNILEVNPLLVSEESSAEHAVYAKAHLPAWHMCITAAVVHGLTMCRSHCITTSQPTGHWCQRASAYTGMGSA